jgi:hypothetical protein
VARATIARRTARAQASHCVVDLHGQPGGATNMPHFTLRGSSVDLIVVARAGARRDRRPRRRAPQAKALRCSRAMKARE